MHLHIQCYMRDLAAELQAFKDRRTVTDLSVGSAAVSLINSAVTLFIWNRKMAPHTLSYSGLCPPTQFLAAIFFGRRSLSAGTPYSFLCFIPTVRLLKQDKTLVFGQFREVYPFLRETFHLPFLISGT